MSRTLSARLTAGLLSTCYAHFYTFAIVTVSALLVAFLVINHDGSLGHQVNQLIQAAKEDEIGTFAVGAMDRVMAASEETVKTMKASSAM